MTAYVKNMFAYDAWANARVIDSLLLLDEVPQRAMEIMSHILSAQRLWYERLVGVPQSVAVWPDYAPADWHPALQENVADMSAYLESLSEDDFQKTVTYHNTQGNKYHTPIHEILTHLTHHSAYHRGQVVILLKTVTDKLPMTDYIVYQRGL